VSGSTVRLALAAALSSTDVVTVSYEQPSNRPLRGLDGAVSSFSGQSVANLVGTAPSISLVSITSDPGDDDTYVAGETILIRLSFNEAVNVDTTDGAPRLKVRMEPDLWWMDTDDATRWADYQGGSGTVELTFAYTVTEANYSPRGIAVLGDGLTLNGSTIRSATDPPIDVNLRHVELDHDRNHQVDGRAPALYGVSVSGTTVALAFNEDLDVDSVPPTGAFTVRRTPQGGSEETVSLSGTPVIAGGAALLTLASPVLETDTDVKVSYAVPAANKLRDMAGNEAAGFTDRAVEATDTTQPRLMRGEVEGDVITFYFSEALDEDSGGVGDRFRLNLGHRSGSPNYALCRRVNMTFNFSIHPREAYVSGNKVVVVGLHNEIEERRASVSWTSLHLRYLPNFTGTNRLRDLSGNPVSTKSVYSDRFKATRYIDLQNFTVLPSLERATVTGDRLTLTFEVPLRGDSVPAAGAFTVKVNGSAVSLDDTNPVAVAGDKVTLTLGAAVAAGDAVTVSYAKPANGWLRNVICEYAESFSDEPAINGTGVTPTVVAITSDPGDDDTYGLGETIEVTLTFSEAVEVTGEPRLKIDLKPESGGEKFLWYESGSGTTSLTFTRQVREQAYWEQPNVSTAGVAVLADSLEMNGGAIRYASSGEPAYLAHSGLDHDPDHKVDWRLPAPGAPSVSSAEITSDPDDDVTYGLDDTILVTLTFSEAVDVDTTGGSPRLKIRMSPVSRWENPKTVDRWANYHSGSGTTELTFAYAVASKDRSPQGIAVLGNTPDGNGVLENTLVLNGGTIKSAGTQTDAHLWYTGLDHDPNHKVDGRRAAAGIPWMSGVAITSDAGHDLTYARGETIRVALTFNEAVNVDTTGGAPRLRIKMDPDRGEKWANYESGGGTTDLVFAYTVAAADRSTQGIAVLGNTLDLNGGTIKSAATQTDAHLWYAGIGPAPNHKVHGGLSPQAPGSPSITNLAISSRPTIGSTYTLGETIRVTLTFSEAVNVDTTGGAPRLKIKMDLRWGEFWADYESGGGTTGLVFAYRVVEPNTSTRGVAVMAQTLELNGGAIRSAGATATDAYLAHTGLGHNPNHRVDWQRSGNCQRPAPGC